MESLPLDHSAGTGPQPPSSIAATLSNNNNNSSSSSEMARKKPATKRSSNNMSTAVGGRDERLVFITLHFSDGTEVWQDGVNGPTPEMMDQTPDESGAQTYMREIPHNERKYVEWTRQLAEGMLAASTDDGWKEAFKSGKQFFFSSLPQGYRLYEQVRVPATGSGGKPRRDTYLYGHPKGPRKRFRSPGDFLVHVKWLSCDETRNPANCQCHACKGGPAPSIPSPPAPVQPTALPTPVQAAAPVPVPAPTPAARKLSVPMTRRSTAAATINNPGVPIPVAAPAPAPTPAPISAPPTFAPPPFEPAVPENILLSSSTQREQEQDLQFPGLSIYRLGEQVWFQTGPHWAIGVVIEVPMAPNTNYKIHPLNSPLICEQTHSHNEIPAVQLRPWVAWSTPPVTNRNLDTEHRTDYENLPWQQESRSGSIEVDASILKSRDVDISYTLIEKLTDRNHYSGVYHGAERFWVGDAVRIKSSSNPGMSTGREILVVSSIQDTTPTTPLAVRCRETGVIITGDVFRLTNHPQTVPPPPGLPSAVLGDLSARGRFAATNQAAPYWTYTLIHRAHAFKLEDIKGRWYPGSSLFRIVHGLEKFTELAQTASISLQEWDETGSRMNEMGTGGAGSTLGWRRFEQRHQAFNKAIPSRFVFTPIPQAAPPDAAMQTLGIHPHHHPHHPHVAAAETAPANPLPETIDLTADENEGMEFLADHDSVDEEFMKRMGEDAQSFLADEGDVFYGGL